MPFADYKNFQDCLQKNKGKDNPEAYCAEMKKKTEKLVDWNCHLSFAKIAEIDDVMYIAGEASNPDEDEDGELMDMESLKGAYDSYMANPVIKFMHDKAPQWRGAIGVVVQKYIDSDGKVWETSFGIKPFLVAKFVKGTMPSWMWKGIQEGNYKGFSIGGKALKKVAGRIYVKSWLETSVVDIPSAHGAFFTVLKMACIGEDCAIEKIETPIDSEEATRVEPYKESKEDKKRNSWHNMSEIIRFKNDFPQTSLKDIQERFGWEEKYIKELLEKIDSVSDKYTQKSTQVDSFFKGGAGSGVKGHRTEREKNIRKDLIVETAKTMYMDNADSDEVDHIKKLLKREIAFRIKNKEYSKQEINDIGLDMHIMVGEIQNQMQKRKTEREEGRKKMVKNPQITSFVKTMNDYVLDSFLKDLGD